MALEIPNLDDRQWADLVKEARSLIPRVAPLWTDHNAHDPGITFIELFAWLAEMQLYQLNRIGRRHQEVFGRLAGVRRKPLQPARLDIRVKGELTAGSFLEAGTQLLPLEGEEIAFETQSNLFLTRSQLQRVIADDGSNRPIDQTEANTKLGVAFLAFGENARKDATLKLGFDKFYPLEPEIRLTAHVFTDDLVGRCDAVDPLEPIEPEEDAGHVDLVWEYLAAGGRWVELKLVSDETAAFSRSGAITLPVPKDAVAGDQGLFWIRSRIVEGYYDIEPRLRSISLNVLPCEQRETVQGELLGQGNGRPDQSFELAKKPVLAPEPESLPGRTPVVVAVADETWALVESFDDSDPGSKHFVFDIDSAQVEFGNGLNGRIPMPGQEIRAIWYQASRGKSSNVARDIRWRLRNAGIPGVTLTNPEPATGGTDLEPLAQMELRARAFLNRPQRAVTLTDFERLALGTPNVYVARANAITDCPVPDSITVVAVPKVRPGKKGIPNAPSGLFLRRVDRHLQRRRLLCDNLRVIGPVYIEVSVSARLRLLKGASPVAVVERANQALGRFLNGELQPADQSLPSKRNSVAQGATQSPCPTRWPFGRSVFPCEVYAILDGVPGVDFASNLALSARKTGSKDVVVPDKTGAIPVPRIGLVYAGGHDLTIEFGRNG